MFSHIQCSTLNYVFGFQNTKAALDHLEAIPEKQGLMENFRDLEVRLTFLNTIF